MFTFFWSNIKSFFGMSKPIPIEWDKSAPNYAPVYETKPAILNAFQKGLPWAQSEEDYKDLSKYYASVEPYKFDKKGYPLNPIGRTHRTGRNMLGRWGVNPAVDCVVGSWNSDTGLFDIILIQRRDNGSWALPGGMLEKPDVYTEAIREFQEEAASAASFEEVQYLLTRERAIILEKIHVIDHRETDNAWVETTPVCFHLSRKELLEFQSKLKSGDDAADVKLFQVDPKQNKPSIHPINPTHWKIIQTFSLSV